MSTLKRIEHFAGLARNSRGTKREEALREMKIAFLDFLQEEHAAQQKMHPTKNGRTKSDSESKPAVFSG